MHSLSIPNFACNTHNCLPFLFSKGIKVFVQCNARHLSLYSDTAANHWYRMFDSSTPYQNSRFVGGIQDAVIANQGPLTTHPDRFLVLFFSTSSDVVGMVSRQRAGRPKNLFFHSWPYAINFSHLESIRLALEPNKPPR